MRLGERRAVLHAGLVAQVARCSSPIPCGARAGSPARACSAAVSRPIGARPRSRGSSGIMRGARNMAFAARELGVVDLAALHDLVLQRSRSATPRDPSARCAASPRRGARTPRRRATARAGGESVRQAAKPTCSMKRSASTRASRPAASLRGTSAGRESLQSLLESRAWVSSGPNEILQVIQQLLHPGSPPIERPALQQPAHDHHHPRRAKPGPQRAPDLAALLVEPQPDHRRADEHGRGPQRRRPQQVGIDGT